MFVKERGGRDRRRRRQRQRERGGRESQDEHIGLSQEPASQTTQRQRETEIDTGTDRQVGRQTDRWPTARKARAGKQKKDIPMGKKSIRFVCKH